MLRIEIHTGNDAFTDDEAAELKRIVSGISFGQLRWADRLKLRDLNGNVVGFAEYVED